MEEKETSFFNWLNLPEELQVEILKRVPVKPLSRSKCVSKSWYNIISTIYAPLSGFLYMGIYFFEGKEFLDYVPSCCYGEIESKGNDFVSSFSSLFPFEPTDEDFLDCCNGLLLYFNSSVVPSEFFVCNPFTKQCIPIPVNPAHTRNSNANFLAFDPCLSPNYRILRICRVSENQRKVDIFSSETGKWVTRFIPVVPEHNKMTRRPVYLNGILYVLTTAYYLLRFDQNLNAQHFELPWKKQTNPYGFIGTSNGNLFYSNNDAVSMMVWLFEDSNCGGGGDCFWTLKHNIKINNLIRSPHGAILKSHYQMNEFKPYALHPFSSVIFIGIPKMIFSYHPETNSFKVFFTAKESTEITWGQNLLYCYRRCTIVLKDFRTRRPSNCIWVILAMRELYSQVAPKSRVYLLPTQADNSLQAQFTVSQS